MIRTLTPYLLVCTLASNVLAREPEAIESFTEPFRKIDVAPAEPGTISELRVREGDTVTKGQLLAGLDRDALLVQLEMSRAAMEAHGKLDSAQAEFALRKSRLVNLETLRQRGHANQEEVNRARADVAIAEANLLAAREQATLDALEYKKTQALIERRTLRSPIDGVVIRVHREEREFVPASSPTVLTVAQLNPLRVVFSLPTALAASLQEQEAQTVVMSETGEAVTGRIELVSAVTDAESGTVRVKVLLDNAAGQLRSGVRCAWPLPAAEPPPTLSIR